VSTLPLAGRRVLVTRAPHQAGKLNAGLQALGAEPVEVPVLEIVPPESYAPLDDALRHLDRYDWLILASANAARAMAERAVALKLPRANPSGLRVPQWARRRLRKRERSAFELTLFRQPIRPRASPKA